MQLSIRHFCILGALFVTGCINDPYGTASNPLGVGDWQAQISEGEDSLRLDARIKNSKLYSFSFSNQEGIVSVEAGTWYTAGREFVKSKVQCEFRNGDGELEKQECQGPLESVAGIHIEGREWYYRDNHGNQYRLSRL